MFCVAQKKDSLDCGHIADTTKNALEGRVTITIKSPIKIADSSGREIFSIVLSKENRMLSGPMFYVHIVIHKGAACLDDDAPVTITFKNGKKEKFTSVANFNCKGEALIGLNGSFTNVKRYHDNAIYKLTVETKTSHVEGTFSDENAQLFQQYLNCLAKQTTVAKHWQTEKGDD